MDPIVSIIMPVYNTEKYLERAINSILNQEYIEWILYAINDGSTDNSGNILDYYSKKDNRIKVFHQSNQGVSSSRQLGVNLATGKYCIHVDSDDWLEPNYLTSLVECAESNNADMVWCDCYRNDNDIWVHESCEDSSEMIGGILSDKCWGSLWNRLIKTDICHIEEVRFPTNCRMWEDKAFVISALVNCSVIKHCRKPLYHYTTNNNDSLLHRQLHEDMLNDIQFSINQIEGVLHAHKLTKFDREINRYKLLVVKDYVDDKRRLNYNKYLNTYPEAFLHMSEYSDFPQRHLYIYWALKHKQVWLVPIILKIDSLLRKIFS